MIEYLNKCNLCNGELSNENVIYIGVENVPVCKICATSGRYYFICRKCKQAYWMSEGKLDYCESCFQIYYFEDDEE